jgi:hypothetical protein
MQFLRTSQIKSAHHGSDNPQWYFTGDFARLDPRVLKSCPRSCDSNNHKAQYRPIMRLSKCRFQNYLAWRSIVDTARAGQDPRPIRLPFTREIKRLPCRPSISIFRKQGAYPFQVVRRDGAITPNNSETLPPLRSKNSLGRLANRPARPPLSLPLSTHSRSLALQLRLHIQFTHSFLPAIVPSLMSTSIQPSFHGSVLCSSNGIPFKRPSPPMS